MKQGRKLTFEEKKEKVIAICEAYATDQFTIESCCKENGITWTTFWNWCNGFNEFNELYKKAQGKAETVYFERLKKKARRALEKKVDGYSVETTETTTGAKGTTVKTSEKHIPSSDTAIIFALTNKDGEHFKNRHNVEHEGLDDLRAELSKLNTETLSRLKESVKHDDTSGDSKAD